MSDSRFVKAKTEGEIVPGSKQKPELRRNKTVERFFAAVEEERESRQYDYLINKKMPVIEETEELRLIVSREELNVRVQLLGDLLTGQKKQPDVEEPGVDVSSAAAAAKM